MSRFTHEGGGLVEDLNQLDDWNMDNIASHLRKRFKVQRPYTSLGNIMVAVNPFEWLDLYDDDLGLAYQEPGRVNLPAHIYKSTAAAYRALLEGQGDQSILISGVSGAGKTETAKLLLGHLATVAGLEEGEKGSDRIQHMVECTVVLETFGNAVMMGNNNSSRYGVVTQLQFDGDIPKVTGSFNRTYLLEKSRVVTRMSDERNFHVFYQMVGSDDEGFKDSLHLSGKTSNDFSYLHTKAPAEDQDFTGLADVQDAVRELGIGEREEADIFKALAGLLHLGQVEFQSDAGRVDDASKVQGDSIDSLEISADLLGLTADDLSGALLTRPLQVAREKFLKPNKVGEAQTARDALAKDVYLGIFNYLLKKINEATSCSENEKSGTISLIDIFGFESFKRNSYEQLLINYASEKLQQMFIQDVFKSVENMCSSEGIAYDKIPYRDNTNILDTLDGYGGVLSMLDEECKLPHGTDGGFVSLLQRQTQKIHQGHLEANPLTKQFKVFHYNNAVSYDGIGFVERNRDKLHTSVSQLLGASTNNMVKMVYAYATDGGSGANTGSETARPASSDFQSRLAMFKLKETGANGSHVRKGKRTSSVMEGGKEVKRETMGLRFKGELAELVERIHATEVQYILCIRPNMANDPVLFDNDYVKQQLLCASILEAAQVYQNVGVDLFHSEFVRRYGKLGPGWLNMDISDQVHCVQVCQKLALVLMPSEAGMEGYEMGASKIFIRGRDHEYLEAIVGFHERVCSQRIVRLWKKKRVVLRKEREEQNRRRKVAEKEQKRRDAVATAGEEEDIFEDAPVTQPTKSTSKSTKRHLAKAPSEDFSSERAVAPGPVSQSVPPADSPLSPLKVDVDESPNLQSIGNNRSDGSSTDVRNTPVEVNLGAPDVEPFAVPAMRAFLNETVPAQSGVIECTVKRKKGVMTTMYQAFYEPTMRLLMTAKKDKGRFIISMNSAYLKRGEPSTLGKVKAVAQRRQYIVYDNGFKANKTLPEKYTIKPERKEIAAVSIDLTRHDDFQGPRKLEVLVADSDDEVVDHASLLNSFGDGNANIITPVPRMHSIKPEWDDDAGYFVLEFYKDRIKKQSVKNFMLHNSRGQFIMQFGRSKEDNVFALDFTAPFSPLAAFGVALANCDCNV